jgi:dipeptidyl aminopeptidase/acylaminoacyl peptidase
MRRFIVAAMLVAAAVPLRAHAAPLLKTFNAAVISPDGKTVASVEGVDDPNALLPPAPTIVMRRTDGSRAVRVAPCGSVRLCAVGAPVWSPDGSRVVFVRRDFALHRSSLEAVAASGTGLRTIVSYAGTLESPRFAPTGALAVLATAGARKEVGATQPGAAIVGEIGTEVEEQRIAVVAPGGAVRMASPADLFVYEYDWLPDGSGFVGTAAHGNGDNNWWVARLYAFGLDGAAGKVLYAPPLQIAAPRVSPDGRSVAFIGGLMSDFGSTGGDIFVVPATGGDAVDVTPGMAASATSIWWNGRSSSVTFSQLAGDRTGVATVDVASHAVNLLWSDAVSLGGFGSDALVSTARDGTTSAVVRQTFERAPEIAVGPIGGWHDLTNANAGFPPAARAQSVTWKSDAYTVQGWLLTPARDDGQKHALIVSVHGGPAAAVTPRFIGEGSTRELLARGYDIFLPNPRGSFGQSEAFVQANVKDFGGGDLRDILAGVDAVERGFPVDDGRLGITGGSYGGYMTMFAVTQTHRFKAAVALAGIANWQSYYGQNGIDEWMIPFFGASVYDDPAVYAKSSPITYIKNVKTPTLIAVGEHDVECPPAQSQEFWHALVTLGVPTSLIIYPGEGHGLRMPAHRRDLNARTLAWFDRYLK